jgi:hypothetical protein
MDINAACKVGGPIAEVQGFHSKLLTELARNPNCDIAVMRLTDGKTDPELKNNSDALRRANWELNLNFAPGLTKQSWTLWPHKDGEIDTKSSTMEGEGDASQIAHDICTIITRRGAKILN